MKKFLKSGLIVGCAFAVLSFGGCANNKYQKEGAVSSWYKYIVVDGIVHSGDVVQSNSTATIDTDCGKEISSMNVSFYKNSEPDEASYIKKCEDCFEK